MRGAVLRVKLSAGSGSFIEHGAQDECAAFVGLLERTGQDVEGEALGLVVHLQCGDALDVPVTLKSMSPRKSSRPWMSDRTTTSSPSSLIRPMAMPETGALDGHARVHKRESGAAGRSHRGGAVGLHDLGDDADCVGELVLVGKHRQKRALSEGAVADLAALRCAHAANLAGAERREVVVVHVALALGGLDGVQALALVEHAERQDGKHLGLPTLEQAGAVNERQVRCPDGTDLVRRRPSTRSPVSTTMVRMAFFSSFLSTTGISRSQAACSSSVNSARMDSFRASTLPIRESLSASRRAAAISS